MIMYDNTGRRIKEQVLNQQNTKVDISGLRGIYIVQLSDQGGSNVVRNKIVIE